MGEKDIDRFIKVNIPINTRLHLYINRIEEAYFYGVMFQWAGVGNPGNGGNLTLLAQLLKRWGTTDARLTFLAESGKERGLQLSPGTTPPGGAVSPAIILDNFKALPPADQVVVGNDIGDILQDVQAPPGGPDPVPLISTLTNTQIIRTQFNPSFLGTTLETVADTADILDLPLPPLIRALEDLAPKGALSTETKLIITSVLAGLTDMDAALKEISRISNDIAFVLAGQG